MDRLECFHPARCATCWHHRDDEGCTLQSKVSSSPHDAPRSPPRGRQVTLGDLAQATA